MQTIQAYEVVVCLLGPHVGHLPQNGDSLESNCSKRLSIFSTGAAVHQQNAPAHPDEGLTEEAG